MPPLRTLFFSLTLMTLASGQIAAQNQLWSKPAGTSVSRTAKKEGVPPGVYESGKFGCIITVPDVNAGGSGILLKTSSKKDGYVFTCGHLFLAGDDRTPLPKNTLALLDFGNGEKWKGYLQAQDMRGGKDLAVIIIPGMLSRTKLTGAPIAEKPLSAGERVWYWGYDYRRYGQQITDSVFVHDPTELTGQIRPAGSNAIYIEGGSVSGMSGGPILNERGEVVSSISGTTDDPSRLRTGALAVATTTTATTAFLSPLGDVPGRPFDQQSVVDPGLSAPSATQILQEGSAQRQQMQRQIRAIDRPTPVRDALFGQCHL